MKLESPGGRDMVAADGIVRTEKKVRGNNVCASKKTFSYSRKRMAIRLAALLPLLRLSRAGAQEENNVGYRREIYRENDDRIKVNTDSFHLDFKLSDALRVKGEVVLDAISGATPTGAPPQTKWPFQTFNQYAASAYQQAFASQFGSYIQNNIIYADAGYITYLQLTNDATVFAQNSAPTIATNSAIASYQALTNSPNYRNKHVPLTDIKDKRTAFSLQLPIAFGRHEISPSFSYSTESDYISYGGALNYSLALNNKNTTLSAGWSHNSDRVRDDQFVWQDKTTDDGFLGVVQLLSPKSYITFNASLGVERGYLADPYRGIMPAMNFPQLDPNDAALIPEKRPDHRSKEIAYLAFNQFVTPLNGAVEVSYRFFHDSYEIFAHTAQLTWHQKIGQQVIISPYLRYYQQSAAYFYYEMVPDYNNLPSSYSSDYRLSHFQSLGAGVDITWRVHKYVSLDAGYLRYDLEGLDGVTSQSAYPSANVFTVGLRVWF